MYVQINVTQLTPQHTVRYLLNGLTTFSIDVLFPFPLKPSHFKVKLALYSCYYTHRNFNTTISCVHMKALKFIAINTENYSTINNMAITFELGHIATSMS